MWKPILLFNGFLSLFLSLSLVAQEESDVPGIRPSSPEPQKTSETAAKIIDLHLAARGGKDKVAALVTLKRAGKVYEGQEDYSIDWEYMFPFKLHINTSRTNLGWTFESIKAYNGVFAWQKDISPDQKDAVSLSPDEAKRLAFEANLPVLFLDHKKKGFIFTYKGEADFAGKPVYILRGWLFPDFEVDFFFDKKTFLIINYRMLDNFAGKSIKVDRMPTGMKKFNGVWMDTGFDFRLEGKSYRKIEYKETKVNTYVDSSLFAPPRKVEKWLR